jgi:hypothetical protein
MNRTHFLLKLKNVNTKLQLNLKALLLFIIKICKPVYIYRKNKLQLFAIIHENELAVCIYEFRSY